jgi:hypothetical protein
MSEQQERRILSRYAGVSVDNVARLENVPPYEVRALRARRGRSVDDGHPHAAPSWKEHLSFDDVDRMMRTNRSAPA